MTQEQREDLFRYVFCTAEGQQVLAEIRRYSGSDKVPFNPDSDRLTAFACGKAEVGKWIEGLTKAKEKKSNG